MKKKLYIGSNLKMYKNVDSTLKYLTELETLTKDIDREEVEVFIIPSYTSLESATKKIDPKLINIGAQNMCWEAEGQFTGEISPLMLKELNINLVMLGHSERRHIFHETDFVINKKVNAALRHGIHVLLCIGETLEEKEYGVSCEVLRSQLKIAFHNVNISDVSNIWVAYEPVWSIGVNGIPATSEYAEKMHKEIKKCLVEIWGEDSKKIPVLYGGSVNPNNAEDLISQPSIDGLFIGRAAWNAENMNNLIRTAKTKFEAK